MVCKVRSWRVIGLSDMILAASARFVAAILSPSAFVIVAKKIFYLLAKISNNQNYFFDIFWQIINFVF